MLEPIDIVYLWCDSRDKRFRADKKKYSTQEMLPMLSKFEKIQTEFNLAFNYTSIISKFV